jgi:hypothetical protein
MMVDQRILPPFRGFVSGRIFECYNTVNPSGLRCACWVSFFENRDPVSLLRLKDDG